MRFGGYQTLMFSVQSKCLQKKLTKSTMAQTRSSGQPLTGEPTNLLAHQIAFLKTHSKKGHPLEFFVFPIHLLLGADKKRTKVNVSRTEKVASMVHAICFSFCSATACPSLEGYSSTMFPIKNFDYFGHFNYPAH